VPGYGSKNERRLGHDPEDTNQSTTCAIRLPYEQNLFQFMTSPERILAAIEATFEVIGVACRGTPVSLVFV
jgi:hypothetical protein